MKKSLLLIFAVSITCFAYSQHRSYEIKNADKKDVSSPDAIIGALYAVISGEAGAKRDWERFKSLWYPGANLTMVTPIGNNLAKQITMDVDEFIKLSGNHSETNSFYEIEINRKTDQIGHIAQVVSTYSIKDNPKAKEYKLRGVNLFQLYFDGSRWWILNCVWENEIQGVTIPKEYLKER